MKLREALRTKKFIVTSEVNVPMGNDASEDLVDNLKCVRGRVDAVSVADINLEGVVSDSIKASELLTEEI